MFKNKFCTAGSFLTFLIQCTVFYHSRTQGGVYSYYQDTYGSVQGVLKQVERSPGEVHTAVFTD